MYDNDDDARAREHRGMARDERTDEPRFDDRQLRREAIDPPRNSEYWIGSRRIWVRRDDEVIEIDRRDHSIVSRRPIDPDELDRWRSEGGPAPSDDRTDESSADEEVALHDPPIELHSWLWRTASRHLEEVVEHPRPLGGQPALRVADTAIALLAGGPGAIPDLKTAALGFPAGQVDAVQRHVDETLLARLGHPT